MNKITKFLAVRIVAYIIVFAIWTFKWREWLFQQSWWVEYELSPDKFMAGMYPVWCMLWGAIWLLLPAIIIKIIEKIVEWRE